MNGSGDIRAGEELHDTLQGLRARVDPADRRLIDALEKRARNAERECERLRDEVDTERAILRTVIDQVPVGAVAVVSNVTGDKHAEDELRRDQDRMALALDAMQAGVSFWDLENDRTQWNLRQFELLGYAPGSVEPGMTALLDRLHPADRRHAVEEIDRSIREREDFVMDYRVCLPGGEERWMHSIRRFIYDAAGRAVSSHGIMYDITEQRHYEAIRRQAYTQIEQNMEQFAILGDHIRHPLQVIMARADLLDDAKTAASIREQVRRINEIIKQLDEGWVESRAIREFLRRNDLA